MKIAKEFRWEMGHRLPYHESKCRNIHGHSYKMLVELIGDIDKQGMVLDYYDVKEKIQPHVDELDHSCMVKSDDAKFLKAVKELDSKHVIVDFHSTAENICLYFLDKIKNSGLPDSIKHIKVRIYETETTYAEDETDI